MTHIKEFGWVLASFFNSTNIQSVFAKGFPLFWRFLGLNVVFSFLFYGVWLFLTYKTKVVMSFDYVSWMFPFLFNIFLISFAVCLMATLSVFLFIHWLLNRLNRNDLDVREYVLASLYTTVITSNIVMIFAVSLLFLFEQVAS